MVLMGSIIDEIHVLIAAFVLFLLLPWWTLSRRVPSAGSRMTVGLSFWILLVSGLAYVSMVRYAVLLVSALVGIVWIRRTKTSREPDPGDRFPSVHLFEGFERPLEQGRKLWQRALASLRDRARRLEGFGWLGFLMVCLALGAALVVGSWPWLHQAAPGTSNGYTNLLRIASVAANHGLYPSGAAPVGLSALGATLSVAFFLPPMEVLRFLYPLAAVFTVIATGAFAYQVTRSPRVTAVVMTWVSVSRLSHFGLHMNFETPLAIHWALVLVILGLAELVASVRESGPSHRAFGAMALLAAALISPPEALVGILMAVVIATGQRKAWGRVILGAFGVMALAALPIAAAILTGKVWSPSGWLVGPFPPLVPIWHAKNWTRAPYIMVWIGLALPVMSYWRHADPVRRRFNWILGGLALLEGGLGTIPTVASAVLWSGLLGLIALVSGADLLLGGSSVREKEASGTITGLMATLAVIGGLFPVHAIVLRRYEPARAASTTLRIENHFSPYQWTIISPVQQFSETLGRGWHEELATFVKGYPLRDARNPQFQLRRDRKNPILSPDVFLFVEPTIYPAGSAVSRKDLKIPVTGGSQAYQGRSLLGVESRAYYWAIAYHRSHPLTSQIYTRTGHLMVLWIRQ